MPTQRKRVGRVILIGIGILLIAMILLGQTMSLIDYDFTVSLGLQEAPGLVTAVGVATNKGFGLGDTLIYLPLLISGLIGFWRLKRWALIPLTGALAITAYWPVTIMGLLFFAKDAPGFNFVHYTTYTLIMVPIGLYGIWGLWYLHRNQKMLTQG